MTPACRASRPTAGSAIVAVAVGRGRGFRGLGLKHVLCTDIERDGALGGPMSRCTRSAQRFPQIQWQASGGIATAARPGGAGAPACRGHQRQGAARERIPPRSCGHSCQTHNPLPRRARRPGGQGRALSRSPHGRRHPGTGARYRDEGADELVFYDITASPEGRSVDRSWVSGSRARSTSRSASPAASARSRTPRRCSTPAPRRSRSTRRRCATRS
jgi:hypothetical protein